MPIHALTIVSPCDNIKKLCTCYCVRCHHFVSEVGQIQVLVCTVFRRYRRVTIGVPRGVVTDNTPISVDCSADGSGCFAVLGLAWRFLCYNVSLCCICRNKTTQIHIHSSFYDAHLKVRRGNSGLLSSLQQKWCPKLWGHMSLSPSHT